MTNVLLYSHLGGPTLNWIAKHMQQEAKIIQCRNGIFSKVVPDIDILVRFATIAACNARVTYNPSKAIALASDKARAREHLFVNGVPVPSPGHMILPCIGRPRRHRGGRQVFFCQTRADVEVACEEGADYFSAYYNKTREYRVHVCHGQVLIVNEKVTREGEEHKRNLVVWNHALNDFRFDVVRWKQWPVEVVRLAIKAIRVTGLDFGAVDILAEPKDSDLPPAVVCEINTAGTADSDYTASRYALYFDWLLGARSRRVPFDVRSENPVDYAFKRKKK